MTSAGVLDPDRVIATCKTLNDRICRRFPEAGIGATCRHLLSVSRRAKRRAASIGRPIVTLRLAVGALVLMLLAAPVMVAITLEPPSGVMDLFTFAQLFDSAARDIALVAVAVFFLLTLEARVKRVRILRATRELRSVAHVIDMHQLAKDPGRAASSRGPGAPVDTLTRYEMCRYLDYCTEMLSLTGKIAAIYVQDFDDPVAVQAVNEIESLTAGLSHKILQKMLNLHQDESLTETATFSAVHARSAGRLATDEAAFEAEIRAEAPTA